MCAVQDADDGSVGIARGQEQKTVWRRLVVQMAQVKQLVKVSRRCIEDLEDYEDCEEVEEVC
jgi:hypothetical protein